MRMQIYFNDTESDFVKEQGEGWVRKLVQNEMEQNVPIEKIEPKEVRKVAGYDNPWTCKACGHVKMSGKCINKECKLKGKIQ